MMLIHASYDLAAQIDTKLGFWGNLKPKFYCKCVLKMLNERKTSSKMTGNPGAHLLQTRLPLPSLLPHCSRDPRTLLCGRPLLFSRRHKHLPSDPSNQFPLCHCLSCACGKSGAQVIPHPRYTSRAGSSSL